MTLRVAKHWKNIWIFWTLSGASIVSPTTPFPLPSYHSNDYGADCYITDRARTASLPSDLSTEYPTRGTSPSGIYENPVTKLSLRSLETDATPQLTEKQQNEQPTESTKVRLKWHDQKRMMKSSISRTILKLSGNNNHFHCRWKRHPTPFKMSVLILQLNPDKIARNRGKTVPHYFIESSSNDDSHSPYFIFPCP